MQADMGNATAGLTEMFVQSKSLSYSNVRFFTE